MAEAQAESRLARLWTEHRINEEYCASYFARLRTMAELAAARHLPAAT
ncbi:hypothetical protein ACWGR4_31140 [Embleya sp. NPDC055664]